MCNMKYYQYYRISMYDRMFHKGVGLKHILRNELKSLSQLCLLKNIVKVKEE